MKKEISNWGNYPKIKVEELSFSTPSQLENIIKENKGMIARGMGRCYGDASLSNQHIINTLKFDKIIEFDIQSGIFEAQSGISFDTILEFIIPKGWFLPVTPGTKYITLGGAVASDIHGKNHHAEGSFSRHILNMQIITHEGKTLTCSPRENEDLFWATCGGMGLTGIIQTVRFQLKKIETSFIKQIQVKAKNLDHIIELFEKYQNYTYSMAWIDCLKGGNSFGRSIMMAGEHALLEDLKPEQKSNPLILASKPKLIIPFDFPNFALNTLSVKAFNFLYYNIHASGISEKIIPYNPFFYPLDSILHWNRMYGKKGFVQYQFVLPLENSRKGLVEILSKIRKRGMGSFLAVLKLFGEQENLISFPMKGYTLALDFPVQKGLFPFLDELDEIVLSYQGRLYLTKDARMKSEVFHKSYPQLKNFQNTLLKYSPEASFSSLQSERLSLTH
jgi:FAD/FMN-containing dehydrogenase